MSIAAALAELERSPEMLDHIEYLKAFVADEQRRRKKFADDLGVDTKAEFINGQVFRHPAERHDEIQILSLVAGLLGNFVNRHNLGQVLMDRWLVRCQRNDYMPDVSFFLAKKCADLKEELRIFPPPDLVVEILSPATESNDRKLKLQDYARHGVGEYWIVDPEHRMIEQYVMLPETTAYQLKARLSESGRLSSVIVIGLEVRVAALLDVQENQRAIIAILNRA